MGPQRAVFLPNPLTGYKAHAHYDTYEMSPWTLLQERSEPFPPRPAHDAPLQVLLKK